MGVIISAFIAVILFLLAAGVGLSVLKLFRLSTIKPEDAGVYGAALGIGLFGYLILALGIAGQFNLVAVLVGLAALVVPALLGLNWLCRLWRENREVVEPGVEKSRPFLWWVSVSVIGLVAVCGVIAALAPQFGADTLRYHLAAPKWFIRVGRVEFVPFFYFNLPMNIEMIWGLGLLFQRESVGIVIHWFMGLLAASGVYLICREHINKAGSLLAAAVLLTMPLVTYNATGSSNDLPVMLYTVLAVHGFLHWRKNQKKEWLYLAAVMSGFAAANKYTGLYTPFALMVCLCVAIIKDRQWSQIRSLLPLCVLVTVVAGSPWYLKNLLFTGNPVWPMFYPILGGKGWSGEINRGKNNALSVGAGLYRRWARHRSACEQGAGRGAGLRRQHGLQRWRGRARGGGPVAGPRADRHSRQRPRRRQDPHAPDGGAHSIGKGGVLA